MRAEPLFLRRCEQVANFLQSQSEVDLLDIARILRQIMMDNHSLMDTANINRIKTSYSVGLLRNLPTGIPNRKST
jgi:hypothetical protein